MFGACRLRQSPNVQLRDFRTASSLNSSMQRALAEFVTAWGLCPGSGTCLVRLRAIGQILPSRKRTTASDCTWPVCDAGKSYPKGPHRRPEWSQGCEAYAVSIMQAEARPRNAESSE